MGVGARGGSAAPRRLHDPATRSLRRAACRAARRARPAGRRPAPRSVSYHGLAPRGGHGSAPGGAASEGGV